MSDLFPDDPRAVTARREAAVRGINDAIDAEREEAAQGRRFFSARDPADLSRGVASASYRLSELGGTVAFRAFDLVNDATHAVTGWDPEPNENMRAYEDALARSMREHRTRLAPDPVRSSYAGEILYGLGEIGALAASGGPVAGLGPLLTGGGMGVATAHELIDEGVDEQTAWRAGGIEGVSMSALVAAPVALPSRAQTLWARVAQRAATGAGINSVLGIGYRGAMSEYLRSQGYDDQASRYDAFDAQSLIADVVLGAAFGGLFGRRGAPRQRGGADAEDAAPRLSAEEHLDRAVEAYEGGDLVTARAHALMADRLGEQEGAFLAEEWGREGGQELVEDSQARSLLMAVEEGLIKPDEAMRDAAMLVQAERRANVDEAPGVALNLEGEALHARNMDAFDRAAAQGDEFPQAEWSAAEAENFAPHLPRDTSEAEAVVREVLEAEGYPELAREIEALRARIRDMGGEIGPDEMMFSFGPPRAARGVDPWRGNEPFHDERLTATQNKIVEMARNNYSNAEIADEMDTSVNTIAATLSKVRAKAPDIAGLTAGRTGAPRGQHDGRATAAIEDIVRLYNKLSRQGYRNWPGRPGFGRENLTPEMREAVMEGQALFARGGEPSALRPADLVAQAERIFGADWKALAAAGHVEIVQSSREVPSAFGLPRGVQAVHMRDTGKTYFIANNIRDPAHMKGLILHEIGVHHGMPDLLGERGFREVLRQIETMVRAEHPEVFEARAWVESKYPNRADWSEETLAVLIETNADLPLVNRVLSKIRQWLIKTFGTTFGMRLTVDDLRALAVTSLRRAAEQARRESGDVTPVAWRDDVVSPEEAEAVMASAREQGYQGSVPGVQRLSETAPRDRLYTARFNENASLASEDGKWGPGVYASVRPNYWWNALRDPSMIPEGANNVALRWPEGRMMTFEEFRDIGMDQAVARERGYVGVYDERLGEVLIFDEANATPLADLMEAARLAPQPPDAGARGGDDLAAGFEMFSFGRNGQNRPDLLGAKRDPIESPDYQRRVEELRSRAGGERAPPRAGEESRGVGGVRGDAAAGGRRAGGDARGGEGPSRALVKEILAVSGIRIVQSPARKSGLSFGAYRAEIDTPIPNDADSVLQAGKGAEGGRTGIDFDYIDGSNPQETRLPGVYLRLTRINDGAKNTGAGLWLYRQLIDWADRRGVPVFSDFSISADAQHIYPALERRGYRVEQIKPAAKDPEDGSLVNVNFEPIFRVSRTGLEEAFDAAPFPRDDYQIDGPTLRERQAAVDEARKRQKAYDELDPVEQALRDEPDMQFSFGHRSKPRRKVERMNLPHPFVGAADVIRNPTKADIETMLTDQRLRDVQSVRWGIDQDGQLIIWDGTQATHSMVGENIGGRFVRDGVIEDALEIDAVLSTAAGVREGRIGGYDPAWVAEELGISIDTARAMLAKDGKLSARDAVDAVRESERDAREMGKGYDAAVRCAIRHGGSMGTRFIGLNARAGAGTAIGTGHLWGMAAGIPGGWAASHMAAENADPEGYRANQARYHMDRARQADQRARDIARAGGLGTNDQRFPVTHSAEAESGVGGWAAPQDTYPQESAGALGGTYTPEGAKVSVAPAAGQAEPQAGSDDAEALIEAFRPLLGGEE